VLHLNLNSKRKLQVLLSFFLVGERGEGAGEGGGDVLCLVVCLMSYRFSAFSQVFEKRREGF